jgi:hypothetical protein
VIFFVPDSSWMFPLQSPLPGLVVGAPPAPDAPAPDLPPPLLGLLRLDIEARGPVQTFVDGVYVGTLDDIGGQVELEEGTHRIELRSPRYEALAVDVKMVASRAITYTARMTPVVSATPVPSAPDITPGGAGGPVPSRPRTTIYFIPGCYLGNVPPEEIVLPAGCDIGQLIIRRP